MKRFMMVLILFSTILPTGVVFAGSAAFIWAKGAGGDGNPEIEYADMIAADGFGGVVITGQFSNEATFNGTTVTAVGYDNEGPTDMFVAKYDTFGNFIWIRHAGGNEYGAGNNGGQGIATDSEGNIIATGQYIGSIGFDGITLPANGANQEMYLVKYDMEGNALWAKAGTGPYANKGTGVATDNSGNIFVTGSFAHHNYGGSITFDETTLSTYGGMDIFIAKFDSNGNSLWAKHAGSSSTGPIGGNESGRHIVVDESGNCIVTGWFTGSAQFENTTLNSAGGRDAFLAKYDGDGNLLWARRAEGVGKIFAENGTGNIYHTSSFSGTVSFDSITLVSAGDSDIFIAKYDPEGSVIWAKRAGGAGNDTGSGIVKEESTGNLYISGFFSATATIGTTTLTSRGDKDIFIAMCDFYGNFIWAKRAGGAGEDSIRGMAQKDGTIFIAGFFEGTADFGDTSLTSAGGRDILVAAFGYPNQPPTADPGEDQTLECVKNGHADVILNGSASSDPDSTPGTNDDIVSFDWYEGENFLGSGETMNHSFPLGEHLVTLVVTDSREITDEGEIVITVQDTTQPELSAAVSKDLLWPPNHKMVDVGLGFEVSDICDSEPYVSIVVTSDEPTATITGAGGSEHAPDAEITDDSVFIRAERSGDGDGRVYRVTVSAEDVSGNAISEDLYIRVNLSKKKTAFDSGQNYDATVIN